MRLCNPCHLEWHAVELSTTIPFEEWMQLPTLGQLLSIVKNLGRPELRGPSFSALEFRQILLGAHEADKQRRITESAQRRITESAQREADRARTVEASEKSVAPRGFLLEGYVTVIDQAGMSFQDIETAEQLLVAEVERSLTDKTSILQGYLHRSLESEGMLESETFAREQLEELLRSCRSWLYTSPTTCGQLMKKLHPGPMVFEKDARDGQQGIRLVGNLHLQPLVDTVLRSLRRRARRKVNAGSSKC